MTEADLHEHLAYWQGQLGLQAWTITLRVVRAWDMPVSDARGTMRRTPALMRATIWLLDDVDVGPEDRDHHDPEQVLVHDLLHVYHHSGEPGSAVDLLEEMGVEMTARALVRLRRGDGR